MLQQRVKLVKHGKQQVRSLASLSSSIAKPSKGGPWTIGLIAGDGIGKEVVPAARRVLEALPGSHARYAFREYAAGFEHFQKHGTALPEETIHGLSSECQGAIFGAVSSPSHKVAGYSSPIVALRKRLDLYANVRPIQTPDRRLDMLIIRENTECLYVKQEQESVDPKTGLRTAIAQRVITEKACRRIGRNALEAAYTRLALRKQQQPNPTQTPVRPAKVTVVHKSNVLSVTDGLFRESVLDEYKKNRERYAEIQVEEQLVDSMVYRLFREPQLFDVVVAPNLYGDIISDGAAALVGSLGLVPGANVGDSFVMGEPVHGSAPDIYGKRISNPLACIRSAALLLEYLGELQDASRIYAAVDRVLVQGNVRTPDLGGTSGTDQVTEQVLTYLTESK